MNDYGDRRKEARKLVVTFTLVYESKKGKLLGYLRDLTLNGAQVSGNKELDIGTEVSLYIELPSDLPGVRDEYLYIGAKVARCITVTEEPASYAIGFEFTNLQPEQIEVIEILLKRYHFQHKLH
ncbi:MAG: PilZ domain-containing protein [Anaerolineae bacterium]|jgi:Tfp pilus assembly protein PilZ|nr:PilZ domain-containing protein [Anaerolineae bacterium]MBT3712895.1 PilZ domain-containing protein [Anaerolineae bacterium]MBT4312500.1 PilZ domain-containing protein [Anaerolineae bacterium]MBT4458758.1 PilZ domain-containing protein [Anaerolineae bacterium]MBT4842232.1 PilZ domain-containing protein [Anaerolineae bacterium]